MDDNFFFSNTNSNITRAKRNKFETNVDDVPTIPTLCIWSTHVYHIPFVICEVFCRVNTLVFILFMKKTEKEREI